MASVASHAEVLAASLCPPLPPVCERAAAWPRQAIPASSIQGDLADRLDGKLDQVCIKLDKLSDGVCAMVATISDLAKAMREPRDRIAPALALPGRESSSSSLTRAGDVAGTSTVPGDLGAAPAVVLEGSLIVTPLCDVMDKPEAEQVGHRFITGHSPAICGFC